jgi:hypothetical protein
MDGVIEGNMCVLSEKLYHECGFTASGSSFAGTIRISLEFGQAFTFGTNATTYFGYMENAEIIYNLLRAWKHSGIAKVCESGFRLIKGKKEESSAAIADRLSPSSLHF